mgnify:CR=1 FL=1
MLLLLKADLIEVISSTSFIILLVKFKSVKNARHPNRTTFLLTDVKKRSILVGSTFADIFGRTKTGDLEGLGKELGV